MRSRFVTLFVFGLLVTGPGWTTQGTAAWAVAEAGTGSARAREQDPFGRATRLALRYTPPAPLSSWAGIDDEILRLATRGELPIEAHSFRPVDRGEVAAWLLTGPKPVSVAHVRVARVLREEIERYLRPQLLDTKPYRHPAKLYLYDERIEHVGGRRGNHGGDQRQHLWVAPYVRFMPRFGEGRSPHWTDSTRVGFRAAYTYGSRFTVQAGLFAAEVAEGRTFADPLVAGTDLILQEEELTASLRWGPFRLRAGRDRHGWGPGISGTLLLSEAADPFNFAEYQVRLGSRLRAIAIYGATSVHQHRYLAAHRLTWTPRPNLSVSLSEAARFESDANHPLYAMGFVPYTLVERFDFQDSRGDSTRDEQRNNVMWDVELIWRPRSAWMLYTELLADDIATETAEQPTRGAVQLGIIHAPRWYGWDWSLGLEYTRVSNYTYSVYYQDLCRCDWEHQNEPLGYRYGPDSEVWLLRAGLDLDRDWGGELRVLRLRRGEGRIGVPWRPSDAGCADEDPHCGDVDAWSLSGTVEMLTTTEVAIHYRPGNLLRVSLWGGVEHARHPDHQAGAASTTRGVGGLRLSLGYH